jgi:hypothetical protein
MGMLDKGLEGFRSALDTHKQRKTDEVLGRLSTAGTEEEAQNILKHSSNYGYVDRRALADAGKTRVTDLRAGELFKMQLEQQQRAKDEYERDLINRDWLKTYDPIAGGRALGTEAFGAVSEAVDRGAQDLVKGAGLGGFRYDDANKAERTAYMDKFNALPETGRRDLLADLSTGIGGKVEGITKEAVLQEDVYNTVYNDVMRQTGDSALAAKEATARAGQYTSRADLKAQAEAAAKDRQELYKRMYDVSKDQLGTRQKQQDYQFKALKEVLDLEKAGGTTTTKVDGKKTYADAYDNLDKLSVTPGFWPSFTGLGDEASGRRVINLAREYEIPPSVIMKEMNDNLRVGAGRGWNEDDAEKFVASVRAKYPDGYGKVTDSSRQNLIDRIPQMAAPTTADLEIANKYRAGVSAMSVSELQADRVQKAIEPRFGVARSQTPVEVPSVTRPGTPPGGQGSGRIGSGTVPTPEETAATPISRDMLMSVNASSSPSVTRDVLNSTLEGLRNREVQGSTNVPTMNIADPNKQVKILRTYRALVDSGLPDDQAWEEALSESLEGRDNNLGATTLNWLQKAATPVDTLYRTGYRNLVKGMPLGRAFSTAREDALSAEQQRTASLQPIMNSNAFEEERQRLLNLSPEEREALVNSYDLKGSATNLTESIGERFDQGVNNLISPSGTHTGLVRDIGSRNSPTRTETLQVPSIRPVSSERVPNEFAEVAEIVSTPANELSIADVDSAIARLQEDLTNPSNIRMDTSRQLSAALRALQQKRLEMLRMSPQFGSIVREVPEYP